MAKELNGIMVDDNKYEVQGAENAQQIKDVFDYAKDNNIEHYRALSKSGASYGWDESIKNPNNGSWGWFVKNNGDFWYKNPYYVVPAIEEENAVAKAAEEVIVDEVIKAEPEVIPVAMADTVKVAEAVAPEPTETIVAVDYETLYKNSLTEIASLKEEIDSISVEKHKAEAELSDIKYAFKIIAEAYEKAKNEK